MYTTCFNRPASKQGPIANTNYSPIYQTEHVCIILHQLKCQYRFVSGYQLQNSLHVFTSHAFLDLNVNWTYLLANSFFFTDIFWCERNCFFRKMPKLLIVAKFLGIGTFPSLYTREGRLALPLHRQSPATASGMKILRP